MIGSLGSISTAVFLSSSNLQLGPLFGGQLVVDGSSLFFVVIISSVTLLVSIASYDYISKLGNQAEYYSLLLLAATGLRLMASAKSLVIAFIAMELASLPSYALVTYLKTNESSTESGLKYFLIGALSSAIFVYGSSLIYGATGSLGLSAISE